MPFGIVGMHGDGAAGLRDRAAYVFELDGGVGDVEAVFEDLVEAAKDAVAGRGRDIFDQDMAAQRVSARAEAPDMEVVDVEHAVDGAHGGGDIAEVNAARQAFK